MLEYGARDHLEIFVNENGDLAFKQNSSNSGHEEVITLSVEQFKDLIRYSESFLKEMNDQLDLNCQMAEE